MYLMVEIEVHAGVQMPQIGNRWFRLAEDIITDGSFEVLFLTPAFVG